MQSAAVLKQVVHTETTGHTKVLKWNVVWWNRFIWLGMKVKVDRTVKVKLKVSLLFAHCEGTCRMEVCVHAFLTTPQAGVSWQLYLQDEVSGETEGRKEKNIWLLPEIEPRFLGSPIRRPSPRHCDQLSDSSSVLNAMRLRVPLRARHFLTRAPVRLSIR